MVDIFSEALNVALDEEEAHRKYADTHDICGTHLCLFPVEFPVKYKLEEMFGYMVVDRALEKLRAERNALKHD